MYFIHLSDQSLHIHFPHSDSWSTHMGQQLSCEKARNKEMQCDLSIIIFCFLVAVVLSFKDLPNIKRFEAFDY